MWLWELECICVKLLASLLAGICKVAKIGNKEDYNIRHVVLLRRLNLERVCKEEKRMDKMPVSICGELIKTHLKKVTAAFAPKVSSTE